MNVFCLPFAGGNQYSYLDYKKIEPDSLNFIFIEIPGRSRRIGEKLLTNLHDIAEDVFYQIKNNLKTPYAIYGHSMGSILGYLITQRIVQENLNPPKHLFFSGAMAPSLRDKHIIKHDLPRKEFFEKIRTLGGSPEEVLNNDALMDIFEPILRSDFRAVETYKYKQSSLLNIPITVMIGIDENITKSEAMAWGKETQASIEVIEFTGNHFFIYNHQKEIVKIIENKLIKYEKQYSLS